MNVKFKKSLKIVTLLISAIIIGSVSATTYNYMNQIATIGVEGLNLAWTITNAPDAAAAGTTIAGATCSLPGLEGPAGGTRTYADPVRLTATAATNFNVTIASISGSTSEMTSIIVKLYDLSDNSLKGTLTVWSGGAQGADLTGLSIANAATWRFQWEISWAAGATGTVSVTLKIQTPAV